MPTQPYCICSVLTSFPLLSLVVGAVGIVAYVLSIVGCLKNLGCVNAGRKLGDAIGVLFVKRAAVLILPFSGCDFYICTLISSLPGERPGYVHSVSANQYLAAVVVPLKVFMQFYRRRSVLMRSCPRAMRHEPFEIVKVVPNRGAALQCSTSDVGIIIQELAWWDWSKRRRRNAATAA